MKGKQGKRAKLGPGFECHREEIEKESFASEEGLYLKSEKLFAISHDSPVILLRTIVDKNDVPTLFEVIYLSYDDFDKIVLLVPDDLETWVPEVMKEFEQWLEG